MRKEKTRVELLTGIVPALFLLILMAGCQKVVIESVETVQEAIQQPIDKQALPAGLEIVKKGTLLEIKSDSLISENIADEIRGIQNIVKVEKYLYVKINPNDIIGVEPLNPLRISDEIAEVRAGRNFEQGDENVAIVGRNVNSNPYGGGMIGTTMAHYFSVGQSFRLNDERIIVVGIYLTKSKNLQENIFLPLLSAQKLYGKEGRLSNIFIQADSQKNIDNVLQQVEVILKGG